MVGLVLGVVRFPVVMSVEPSVSITAGTKSWCQYSRGNNRCSKSFPSKKRTISCISCPRDFRCHWSLYRVIFYRLCPIALLLIALGLIASYESLALIYPSRVTRINKINTNDAVLFQSKNRLLFLELLIGFGVGFLGGSCRAYSWKCTYASPRPAIDKLRAKNTSDIALVDG